MSEETYPTPEHGWVCFHCGEHFPGNLKGARAARLHFGEHPAKDPVCTMSPRRLRDMEEQLERYRDEDTALHREIQALKAAHAVALQREEEKGYARGLADARAEYAQRVPEGSCTCVSPVMSSESGAARCGNCGLIPRGWKGKGSGMEAA